VVRRRDLDGAGASLGVEPALERALEPA